MSIQVLKRKFEEKTHLLHHSDSKVLACPCLCFFFNPKKKIERELKKKEPKIRKKKRGKKTSSLRIFLKNTKNKETLIRKINFGKNRIVLFNPFIQQKLVQRNPDKVCRSKQNPRRPRRVFCVLKSKKIT